MTPRALLACALLLGATSCYAPGVQWAAEARELYREAGFGQHQLAGERVTFVAARVSFGNETYRRVVIQGLVDAMREQPSAEGVVHPNVMANRINEAGLTADYARMLDEYDRTGILGAAPLAAIADTVEVRYFAVPSLVNFQEQVATRLSAFGMRIGKTASATARFQLQIWDGQTGHIVWEGLSDVTLAQEMIRENPVRLDDVVRATWDRLLEEMPGSGAVAAPAP